MIARRSQFRKTLRWLIIGLPIAAVLVLAWLPLRPVFQQAMVGIVFIWFQFGLLFGVFSN
jgi:hypothetical protein